MHIYIYIYNIPGRLMMVCLIIKLFRDTLFFSPARSSEIHLRISEEWHGSRHLHLLVRTSCDVTTACPIVL